MNFLSPFVYLLTILYEVGSPVACPHAIQASLLQRCTHLTLHLPYSKHRCLGPIFLSPQGSNWYDFPLQMTGLEDMITVIGQQADIRTCSQVWAISQSIMLKA